MWAGLRTITDNKRKTSNIEIMSASVIICIRIKGIKAIYELGRKHAWSLFMLLGILIQSFSGSLHLRKYVTIWGSLTRGLAYTYNCITHQPVCTNLLSTLHFILFNLIYILFYSYTFFFFTVVTIRNLKLEQS